MSSRLLYISVKSKSVSPEVLESTALMTVDTYIEVMVHLYATDSPQTAYVMISRCSLHGLSVFRAQCSKGVQTSSEQQYDYHCCFSDMCNHESAEVTSLNPLSNLSECATFISSSSSAFEYVPVSRKYLENPPPQSLS